MESVSDNQEKPPIRVHEITSFLDLQAEYLKRKQLVIPKEYGPSYVNKGKRNILSISKEEKASKDEFSRLRTERINKNARVLKEEETKRENQRKILEEKAAIYDRMAKGERLMYEDGKYAEFLVDFESKKRELEDLESSTPQIYNKSSQKESGESQQLKEATPIISHYDHTEEKGRVFGASHVPLPHLNEEARQSKISELKQMTEQTNLERTKRKKLRDSRKSEERRRLNRLRVQKGLEPLPSSSEDEADKQTEQQNGVQNRQLSSSESSNQSSSESAPEPPEKVTKYGIREWDKGKIGYMRWISEQRDKRDEEFRPPSFYYK